MIFLIIGAVLLLTSVWMGINAAQKDTFKGLQVLILGILFFTGVFLIGEGIKAI